MKLRQLNRLSKGAVDRVTEVERVTVLSEEELKRAIGGAAVAPEAHAHYNYSSCGSSC